eukprot:1161295-Pelagomonas_calceolata.AAC.12
MHAHTSARTCRDAYQDSIKVGVNGEARMVSGVWKEAAVHAFMPCQALGMDVGVGVEPCSMGVKFKGV